MTSYHKLLLLSLHAVQLTTAIHGSQQVNGNQITINDSLREKFPSDNFTPSPPFPVQSHVPCHVSLKLHVSAFACPRMAPYVFLLTYHERFFSERWRIFHLSVCGTSGSWCAVHASFRGVCWSDVQCVWLSVCWQEKQTVEEYVVSSVLKDKQ